MTAKQLKTLSTSLALLSTIVLLISQTKDDE
jgi:hypothetical protein